MQIICDTHIPLLWGNAPSRLSKSATAALEKGRQDGQLAMADISLLGSFTGVALEALQQTAGQVEEEAVIQGGAADRDLYGELVAIHTQLLCRCGLVVIKLRSPLTVWVVPEHHPFAGESGVEAFVNAVGGEAGWHL